MARIESYISETKTIAFRDMVENATTVALFSHGKPDGDTCGSALALAAVLRKMDKDVDLYCPSEVGGKLTFLDGWKAYRAPKYHEYYDLGIAVDCSDRARLGECARVADFCHTMAVIDHHKTSCMPSELSIVRPNACATAELVYMLIADAFPQYLDKRIGYDVRDRRGIDRFGRKTGAYIRSFSQIDRKECFRLAQQSAVAG